MSTDIIVVSNEEIPIVSPYIGSQGMINPSKDDRSVIEVRNYPEHESDTFIASPQATSYKFT